MEALAKALGLTKGSFYWHFADRGALLAALLEAWERTSVDEVIDQVDHGGGTARDRLRRLFGLAASDRRFTLVDLAVRDWARRDDAVRRRLAAVDDRRMAYLRSLFRELCGNDDEAEARCMLAFALFVGTPFMAAGHPGRSRAQAVQLALDHLLREGSPPGP